MLSEEDAHSAPEDAAYNLLFVRQPLFCAGLHSRRQAAFMSLEDLVAQVRQLNSARQHSTTPETVAIDDFLSSLDNFAAGGTPGMVRKFDYLNPQSEQQAALFRAKLHQRSEELGLQHRTIVANPGYNYVQVTVP